MLKKYVTLYNRETGEERTMLDFHAAYVLRACSDWTDTMPKAAKPVEPETVVEADDFEWSRSEQKPKRKKRGD